MTRAVVIASIAAAVLAAVWFSAQAQDPLACGDRLDLVAQLKDQFHEDQTGFGLTGKGAVVELFVSERGSWTLLLSFPNGRSCLMATGNGWDMAPTKPPGRAI